MGRAAFSSGAVCAVDPDGLNPSQRKFLDIYLKTGLATKAYLESYPGVSYPAAEASAYRLLGNVAMCHALERALRHQIPTTEKWVTTKAQLSVAMGEMLFKPEHVLAGAVWIGKHIGMFKEAGATVNVNVLNLSVAQQSPQELSADLRALDAATTPVASDASSQALVNGNVSPASAPSPSLANGNAKGDAKVSVRLRKEKGMEKGMRTPHPPAALQCERSRPFPRSRRKC